MREIWSLDLPVPISGKCQVSSEIRAHYSGFQSEDDTTTKGSRVKELFLATIITKVTQCTLFWAVGTRPSLAVSLKQLVSRSECF